MAKEPNVSKGTIKKPPTDDPVGTEPAVVNRKKVEASA